MLTEVELVKKDSPPMKSYSFYLASNGIFLFVNNFLYSTLIKKEPDELRLDAVKEKIELNLKKRIPFADVIRIESFCRSVKLLYDSEALIIPMFHPVKEEFRFFIPHQTACAAFVRSDEPIVEQDGFIPIGTIHSHPGSAFHSAGDEEDERTNASGIHCTLGNLEKERPDWVASLVVHGRRMKLKAEDVLEMKLEHPKEWIQKIALDRKVNGLCAPYLKIKG